MCGGDDSIDQIDTTANQIAQAEEQRRNQAFGSVFPFAEGRMLYGLPELRQMLDYDAGTFSRTRAGGRNAILRQAAGAGYEANDPAVQQNLADFEASSGRNFDDRLFQILMANEMARQFGGRTLAGIAASSDPLAALSLRARLALEG